MAHLLSSPQDRFDAKNKTYTTAADEVFRLRPVGPGAIDHKRKQFSSLLKKPKPPMIVVDHGKGRTSEIPNYKDENYQLALAEHETEVGSRLVEWIFSTGIQNNVPETPEPGSVFEAALPEDVKGLTTVTRRYLYFNSLMDSNDYAFLMEAIVGQQGVTQLGLSQAADDFPDNGK